MFYSPKICFILLFYISALISKLILYNVKIYANSVVNQLVI